MQSVQYFPVSPGEDLEARSVDPLFELADLLAQLEKSDTRVEGCRRLHALVDGVERSPEASDSVLSVKRVQTLAGETMPLLLHPAVFPPEHWSCTFAEGLLKNPEAFQGKKLVEIGVGCGWISLLMLKDTEAHEVLGLDINPIAVLMARVNAWLNGTNADGSYRLTRSGRPLPEAFSGDVSDLLEVPLSRNEQFDHIIGCIPQVLHPDPNALSRLDDRPGQKDLYDLSNYCFEQGIIEDRYGLPLVARALTQSHLCLKSGGRITLMMGGRAGHGPIEEMFRRRGFLPEMLWSRRVSQASDTDIACLAQVERVHGVNFHFYVCATSAESIPARTVVPLLSSGRPAYHDVFVYQATPRCKSISQILQNLQKVDASGAWRDLDFSRVSETHAAFLSYLTGSLLRQRQAPGVRPQSLSARLRRVAQLTARFLRSYCLWVVDPSEVVVGIRSRLVPALLKAVGGSEDKVLVSGTLEASYKGEVEQSGLTPVIGNSDLADLLELDSALSPRVCIFAPAQFRDSAAPLVVRLLSQHADRHRDRLYIVDDSQHFQSGCEHTGHLMLKLLNNNSALAPNIVLLYRHISLPYEMTALLNVPAVLRDKLDCPVPDAASQVFYEWLFSDLLRFTVEGDLPVAPMFEAEEVPEGLAWQMVRALLA